MRVAFIVAAILIAGSSAGIIGDTLSTIGTHLNNLKEAGKSLISGALAKGKEILSGAASSLLQGATSLAEKTGLLGAIVGKRDLKNILEGAGKLKDLLKMHGANLMKKFGDAMDKLKAIAMNVHKALTAGDATTDDVDKVVDSVVDDHSATVDAAKRSLASRSVLSDLGDFFAPHLDTLKNTVSTVGTTLKGHATNLWNGIKDQVTALGTKLSGHLDTLKQHGSTLLDHGKNALDALKGAVGDVLSQTLSNVKDPVTGAINTLTDAAGVAANHVAGAIAGAAAGN